MSTSSLRQFVAQNDDFGFEMRVGAVITQSRASEIWHGATYTDPKTDLARQFDYRFKIIADDRCMAFAAECKNINPDSPVVICGRKRAIKEAYHDVVVSHSGRRSTTKRVKRGLQYREDQFVGKSVLRPETLTSTNPRARSNDGEIYGKWSQAIASAHDLILEATTAQRWLFTVVVPLVILPNDTLWSAVYDADGNLETDPTSIKSCTFYVGHPSLPADDGHHQIQPATLSHIHFLTLTGLAEFLTTFDPHVVDWDYWIPDDIVRGYDRR